MNRNTKKPFIYALAAAGYIATLVLLMQTGITALQNKSDTIIIPITMLSIFVLSAAVMGFLFLSEPLRLFLENQKQEAVTFFAKTVGFFTCFVTVFAILLFVL